MTNELINLLWARAFASGHRHTTYRDGIESEYRCISKLQLAGLIHEATEQASQRIAQLETYISDNLHKKAICDCGDSIEPDTGAVCGTCASIEQASQPQDDEAIERYTDGSKVLLDWYSGGADRDGAWSKMGLLHVAPDGKETRWTYIRIKDEYPI